MSENANEQTPAAKKTTAKKTTTKKAAARPAAPKGEVIFMVGNSRGAKHDDRRTVDPKRADELVKAGLARYPTSKR